MKVEHVIIGGVTILTVMVFSGCENILKGPVNATTNEPGYDIVEEFPVMPEAIISESSPSPVPVLDYDKIMRQYQEKIQFMSDEDLLLEWCRVSKDNIAETMVAYLVGQGVFSMDDFLSNCGYYSEWTINVCEISEDTAFIRGRDATGERVGDSFKVSTPNEANDIMYFLHDMIAFRSVERKLNTKYDISTGYTEAFNGREYWEFMLESDGLKGAAFGFYDRVFLELSNDKMEIDHMGLIFVRDCYNKIDFVIENNVMSEEEKMEFVYDNFYNNDEMTIFEKLTSIGMIKNYFVNHRKSDAFSTVLIDGKSMDEWVFDIQIDTVEQLEYLIEQSEKIISEARSNYLPIPDVKVKTDTPEVGLNEKISSELINGELGRLQTTALNNIAYLNQYKKMGKEPIVLDSPFGGIVLDPNSLAAKSVTEEKGQTQKDEKIASLKGLRVIAEELQGGKGKDKGEPAQEINNSFHI